MSLKPIREAVEARMAELAAQRAARYEKMMKLAATANHDVMPNVDHAGNWHAPIEGYVHWETGEVYGKGQFIRQPEKDEWYGPTEAYQRAKTRVMVEFADQAELAELMARCGVDCTFGKPWPTMNPTHSYAYLQGYTPAIRVVEESLAAEAARLRSLEKATKGTAPEGRQTVTGTIRSIRQSITQWGTVQKITVVFPNGSTAWGTRPAFLDGVNEGEEITFTASFKHPEGDTTHAFFTRPTR